MIGQTDFSERVLARQLKDKIETARQLSWVYFADYNLPIFVSGNFAETPTKYCIKVLEQNFLDLYSFVSAEGRKNQKFTFFEIQEKDDDTTTMSARHSTGVITFYGYKN